MSAGTPPGTRTAAPRTARPRTGAPRRPPRAVLALAVVAALVALLRWQVLDTERVTGESMAPTLRPGDVLLVARTAAPRERDLVVFRDPVDGARTVKRVVATAGRRVEVRDAVLFVDGRAVAEPGVDASLVDGLYYGPVDVPAGHLLVLGDNRRYSVDSRAYGPVPAAAVTGRVVLHLRTPWSS